VGACRAKAGKLKCVAEKIIIIVQQSSVESLDKVSCIAVAI